MKKKPLIVISNDDGIKADGIKALYKEFVKFAEVFVIAPENEKSGASHSVTIHTPLKVNKVKFCGSYGYSVSGTPADCVKLAIFNLCKRKPDLIVTGINHGPNYGKFIIYSGTVGAATEAALLGIPAIAVSINDYDKNADFSRAAVFAAKAARQVLSGGIKIAKYSLLNINVPASTVNIKGVKVTHKANDVFHEKYIEKKHKGKTVYFWHVVERVKAKGPASDIDWLEKGYVTLTPLHFDLTDRSSLKQLRIKYKK